jgi:hypothetical protein
MDRMDCIDSFVFADKRTPTILVPELYGLQPLNRQYDAQLLPYPSLYLTVWQLNEPTFFFVVFEVFVVQITNPIRAKIIQSIKLGCLN